MCFHISLKYDALARQSSRDKYEGLTDVFIQALLYVMLGDSFSTNGDLTMITKDPDYQVGVQPGGPNPIH